MTTSDQAWHAVTNASFAVLSHVTPAGEPRSSGVVYAAVEHRLYLAVAPESWKARQIEDGGDVSVTVPVRRGGLLSLLVPIPPATVSFSARATVHRAGSFDVSSLPALARLLPEDRRSTACIVELVPEGRFLTYGIGVSLKEMGNPAVACGHAPVM